MRVNAGSDYITFVDNLLNCLLAESGIKYNPKNYELRVFESFKDLYTELSKKEEEYKLCRLLAGYAWPWVTQGGGSKNGFDIDIEGLKFSWNRDEKDWISSESSFSEIGCIHTTQGYDLNYVGIIFGNEITYNPKSQLIEIIPKNYYDRNGKKGITDPAVLKEYIINIYKTMMYRGIKGTFLYACDKNLMNYLQNSIHFSQDRRPFKVLNNEEAKPYLNCVPLYDISIAAGNFSELQQSQAVEWIELPKPYYASKDFFVCKVVGDSMNKKIPNESWCLFRNDQGGSREGKIVLVEHYKIQDADFGAGFTIKSYHSEKAVGIESWMHTSIVLKPLSDNPAYKEIVLKDDDLEALKVVGIFVAVL